MKQEKKVHLYELWFFVWTSFLCGLELRSHLLKKEQILAQTKRELETMEEYKVCLFRYLFPDSKDKFM